MNARFFIYTAVFTLLLSACVPLDAAPVVTEIPVIVTEEPPVTPEALPVTGVAVVQSAEAVDPLLVRRWFRGGHRRPPGGGGATVPTPAGQGAPSSTGRAGRSGRRSGYPVD